MINIDKELVEWSIDKIKTEYKEDIALLIGQVGGGKIPTDEQNMIFDFFVPATDRGYKLARTFIIEDMGYDLYPISWERLEKIADIEEPRMIFAFAKGEVIYAKSEEEKLRYEKLKEKMLLKLQDKKFNIPQSLKYLETAQEIFQAMLYEDDLCKIRKAAGGVSSYLMNSIALFNGRYLENGYLNFTNDLHKMKEYPEDFESIFMKMISLDSVDEIRENIYKLIKITRDFLMKRVSKDNKNKFEPNYEDLAMWYQEMRYSFRRLQYFTGINSVEDSYLLGCYLQIEFDAVKEDFNLKQMDLMSSFNKKDLKGFCKKANEFEEYLVKIIEENNVKMNKYSSLKEFIEYN